MATPKKTEGPDQTALASLLASVEPFREIRGTMPLQYVIAFVLVAMEEGLGVGEYAKQAGVSMSVMSRHLLDIGERNRHKDPGFGLVYSKPDPNELRKSEVYLTDKGKALKHRLIRQLRR
jgi:DNA-binding MarR family transcriptional regulator